MTGTAFPTRVERLPDSTETVDLVRFAPICWKSFTRASGCGSKRDSNTDDPGR